MSAASADASASETRSLSRTTATAIGFLAVLLWALLALFSAAAGPVPPFQLTAMSFLIGGLIGLIDIRRRGAPLSRAYAHPAKVWAIGVLGLFGYHFFYFNAVQNAPVAEAGLIAYLWPLLIVLFAALLPGERLRLGHVVGAALGLAGAALLLAPVDAEGWPRFAFSLGPDGAYALGFGAAIACALIWSSYSVASRWVGEAPTDAVAGFCLVAALLGAVAHLALETTRWPETPRAWAAVIGLGLGPVGAAFYVWDIGCKRGDIQLLGVAAYAAPLLSTLALIVAGFAEPHPILLAAAGLIVLGSLIAAAASLRGRARDGAPSESKTPG